MKRCKHCGEEKSLSDFCKDTAARDGLRPECRAVAIGHLRDDPMIATKLIDYLERFRAS